ncbi:hypothetical protein SS1G_06342 [Sclerotinia sclerotiorum 1980 UF-70]|uniref:Uncharacterized protein n=2 Tax=Sclerotinia sclerotiorum (strain ATCC 18683 / 1980 / Ss-1) TaxID=665079 RepID=A7ELZ5_SCLS1|nr:hypothetical protein SS1G_06342 [Sclerotinia sclerotiorum 1980 UF-70]APA14450.1 hypothetical protein sscle_13g092200 [Sclerotinia sclerotiorum 1980 UF-70]EDO03861.1 hypothetical protein SS1G_06342 [Sclerotinia sclerotiorum 1980 UF-70]
MEPVAATAAAYGVETAIEGGIAAYYLSKPTIPLKGHLEHVTTTDALPRCGHTMSVISDRAYIFGGSEDLESVELGNDMHELHISTDENNTTALLRSIPAVGDGELNKAPVPSARIFHSATVARNRIFIFGGNGYSSGKQNLKPLEENGRLWIFDPLSSKWSFLDPPPHTTFPLSRSDHISTSSPDGSAIFIHGGKSSDDVLSNDVWVFYLDEGKWTRLPDALGLPRSGTNLACGQGKLWKFNGSKEVSEGSGLRGSIHFLEYPTGGTVDDVTKDLAHSSLGIPKIDCQWEKLDTGSSKSVETPFSSDYAALNFITTGNGRDYLLLALGSDGGEYSSDIWVHQLPSVQYSGAKVKDVVRENLPGVESHVGEWSRLEISGIEVGGDEEKGGAWTGRRYFGSSMTGTKQFMIWGGLSPNNETLGDGWRVIID